MPSVLITGATGFLGRHCLHRLQGTDFEVFAPARSRFDLLNPDQVRYMMAAYRPTHLLHLAWITTPGEFWNAPENARWLASSLHLLRHFRANGGRRCVIAGTCAEYDWKVGGACDESTTPLRPHSLYGRCKNSLRELAEQEQLSLAWGRIFYPYGPGEHPARLLPATIEALRNGLPALCTAGTQERDFLHAHDVADVLVRALAHDIEGPFNIGSGEPVAIRHVVERIAHRLGATDLLKLGARPTPQDEPPVLVANVRRLREELHWSPSMTLEEGLQQTLSLSPSAPSSTPLAA